jgi:hypothetical protein
MALRSGHGNGAGVPRVEVLPPDELPAGLPADARPEDPTDRGPGGRFAGGNRLAQAGGAAKRGRSRLVSRLGLGALPPGNAFAAYRRAASTFRRVQCAELARTVGGGTCGPGPSSIVASAALALAWSRYVSDLAAAAGDPELAIRSARLGETSRQHLLAAHELCAREAAARPAGDFAAEVERANAEAIAATERRREGERRARALGAESENKEDGRCDE